MRDQTQYGYNVDHETTYQDHPYDGGAALRIITVLLILFLIGVGIGIYYSLK